MFSAAVRVLARAATIQLEEAAAAHPRPATRTLLKGKERALPIRRDIRPEPAVVESDLGIHAGSEGIGGKENELRKGARPPLKAGHGMEEHLGSIVDELPQNVESSAGPSRIPQIRPAPVIEAEAAKPATPTIDLRSPKDVQAGSEKTQATSVSRPSPPQASEPIPPAIPPVTNDPKPVSDLPLEKAAVSPPIDTSTKAAVEVTQDPENTKSEDGLPTMSEPPLPPVEEAEDVGQIMHR